ncbi:MAG: hypothetical protein ACRC46_12050 [Thermoguttaceae bacterium]
MTTVQPAAARVPLATGGRYSNLAKGLLQGKNESPVPPSPVTVPPVSTNHSQPQQTVNGSPADQRSAVTIIGDTTMRSGVVLRPLSSNVAPQPVATVDPQSAPSFAHPAPRTVDIGSISKPSDTPHATIVVKDFQRPEEPRVGLSIGAPTVSRSASLPVESREPASRHEMRTSDGRTLTWNDADNTRPTPPLAFGTVANTTPPQAGAPIVVPSQPASIRKPLDVWRDETAVARQNVHVTPDPTVVVFEKSEPIPPGLVPAPTVRAAADPKPSPEVLSSTSRDVAAISSAFATAAEPKPAVQPSPLRDVAVLPPLPATAAEPRPAAPPSTLRDVAVLPPLPTAAAEPPVARPVVRDVVLSHVEPPKPTPNGSIVTEPLHPKQVVPQLVAADPKPTQVPEQVSAPVLVSVPSSPPTLQVAPQIAFAEPPLPPAPPVIPAPRPSPTPLVAITAPQPTPTPSPTPVPLVAVVAPPPASPSVQPQPQVVVSAPKPAPIPVQTAPQPQPQVVVAAPKPAPMPVQAAPQPQPQVVVSAPKPAPMPVQAAPQPQVVVSAPKPAPIPVQTAPQPQPQVIVAEPKPAPIPVQTAPQPQPQVVVSAPKPAPTPVQTAPQPQPQVVSAPNPAPTPVQTAPQPQVVVAAPKQVPIPSEPPRLVAQLPPQAAAPSQVRPVESRPVTTQAPQVPAPRRDIAAMVPPPRVEKSAPLPEDAYDFEAGFSHSSRYAQQFIADESDEDAGLSHSGAFR